MKEKAALEILTTKKNLEEKVKGMTDSLNNTISEINNKIASARENGAIKIAEAKQKAAEAVKRIEEENNLAKDALQNELEFEKLKVADDIAVTQMLLRKKEKELKELEKQIEQKKKELEELNKGK